jgi:hypothetical protein
MWRDKTIINLYDAPLYPRASFSSRKLQPLERRRPYFSYFVLMGAALYCAIYVIDEISDRRVQLHSASPSHQRPAANVVRSTPGAPAPDMSSEAVRFAQADVPFGLTKLVESKKPTTVVAATPKKKRPIAAKPKEDDGMQAYASATNEWRVPHGGF